MSEQLLNEALGYEEQMKYERDPRCIAMLRHMMEAALADAAAFEAKGE